MQDNDDKLLNVREVAAKLALKPSTIRRMIAERRIDTIRPSTRSVRIPARVVREILKTGFRPAVKTAHSNLTNSNENLF